MGERSVKGGNAEVVKVVKNFPYETLLHAEGTFDTFCGF